MTHSLVTYAVVQLFASLFVIGFFYGLIRGKSSANWLLRSLFFGVFVSLFFITMPLLWWSDKKASGTTKCRPVQEDWHHME